MFVTKPYKNMTVDELVEANADQQEIIENASKHSDQVVSMARYAQLEIRTEWKNRKQIS